jgi:drug/metabolite transporter (DMT)-like permease
VLAVVVVLLVCAALFFRSRNPHPWTAILVAALAAGACFTVGGESATDSAGPSVATMFAGIVGLLCVASGVVALVPRPADRPAPQAPSILASSAVALGAIGLLLNVWFG